MTYLEIAGADAKPGDSMEATSINPGQPFTSSIIKSLLVLDGLNPANVRITL